MGEDDGTESIDDFLYFTERGFLIEMSLKVKLSC